MHTLTIGQHVKLHSPRGVKVKQSQRSYPRPCKGIITGRVEMSSAPCSFDNNPPTRTRGYMVLLDKPHPRTGKRDHFISDFMVEKGSLTVLQ